MPRNPYRLFRELSHEMGPGNALLYGAGRIGLRLGIGAGIHRYIFIAQPIADAPLLPRSRGQSIMVRQLAAGDPALRDLPLTQEVLDFRFGQGAICLGALRGDRTIGCLWLRLGPYVEDEVRSRFVLSPAASTCWDFDVWLAPEHRAGLGFARLWDEANAFLRQRGVAWSVSRVSAFNPRSLRSHARLGAAPIGSALYICLGRLQLMMSTMRPGIHLSWGSRSTPDLQLRAPSRPARMAALAPSLEQLS